MRRVLVTCGGGLQGATVLRALAELPDVQLHVADNQADHGNLTLAHRSWHVPEPVAGDAYIPRLLALCADAQIGMVIPATAIDLEALAAAADRFDALGCWVAVSSITALDTLLDRSRTIAWLQDHGLPTPQQCQLSPKSAYPLLGKPKRGWGGKGQIVLSTASELDRVDVDALNRTHQWEPLLHGFVEWSVDLAIGRDGRVSEPGVRRRIKTMGGFATVCEVDQPSEITMWLPQLMAALSQLGGRGLFNVQFIVHAGEVHISDVNPRVGTSAACTVSAGLNPVGHLLGASVTSAQKGRVVRHMHEERELRLPDGIRGVVFDLDDTLLDQKRWILARLELAYIALAEVLGDREAFMVASLQALEEGHRSDMIDAIAHTIGLEADERDRFLVAYRATHPTACPLYCDVVGTLDALQARGFGVALLTDNPASSQRKKLTSCPSLERIPAILTGDLGAPKPAPLGFKQASVALGLPAHALVMVGDNPFRDGVGAYNAGYAAYVQIERPGAFFRFHHDVLSGIGLRTNGIIDRLPQLLAALPTPQAP